MTSHQDSMPSNPELSSNKKKSIDTTDHTCPLSADDHDYYYKYPEDDYYYKYGAGDDHELEFRQERNGFHNCLVETPLEKILSPLEFLFKRNTSSPISRRRTVKIDVDRVIMKSCAGGPLPRDSSSRIRRIEGEIVRLKRATEDIPEIMRVCRNNATHFDSVRSMETFNA